MPNRPLSVKRDAGRQLGFRLRMCISLPVEVKRLMAGHPRVNWSAIAARAFVDECVRQAELNKVTA